MKGERVRRFSPNFHRFFNKKWCLTEGLPILPVQARELAASLRGTSAKVGIVMLKALPESAREDERYGPLMEDLIGELRMWREAKQRAEAEEQEEDEL